MVSRNWKIPVSTARTVSLQAAEEEGVERLGKAASPAERVPCAIQKGVVLQGGRGHRSSQARWPSVGRTRASFGPYWVREACCRARHTEARSDYRGTLASGMGLQRDAGKVATEAPPQVSLQKLTEQVFPGLHRWAGKERTPANPPVGSLTRRPTALITVKSAESWPNF